MIKRHYTEEEIINKYAMIAKSEIRKALKDPSVFNFNRHNGTRVYKLVDVHDVLIGLVERR